MYRSFHFIILFVSFLSVLLFQICTADPEAISNSISADDIKAKPEGAPERVILVYPIEGCGAVTTEGGDTGLELQSPRRARDVALDELHRRLNEFRSAQRRRLSPSDTSSLVAASNIEKSVELKTQYLNALQMEIAQIPNFMTHDDMLDLSSTLPCVEMVSLDYIKTFEDPIESAEDRIINTTDSLASDSTIKNAETKHPSRNLQGIDASLRSEGVDVNGLMTPNDQLFPDQWHLQQAQPWSIQTQHQWSSWKGSERMVVAIIDSGCDLNHPDIAAKKWVNKGEICGDGIDNDKNGYVDDCYGWDWVDNDNSPLPQGSGHGSAASGIIASSTDNQIGVAGICWDCLIMCLRFIRGVEGRVSHQVAAIDYAAKMGAKISNNSYGGYGFSRLEFEVIKRARGYGHLFVSSAGNNNYNTDLPQYDHTPSVYNLDNILAIGASTRTGKKASFSNYGKGTVDIFAPGSNIVTIENGGGYAVVSGTSFAAPMAAGVAALIWSRFPMLNYLEVSKSVVSSCRKSPSLNGLAVCSGVLDVDSAMQQAWELARYKTGGLTTNIMMLRRNEGKLTTTTTATTTTKRDNNSSSSFPTLAPTAFTGYSGWLGAFLSGFQKTATPSLGHVEGGTVMVEDERLKTALGVPYLLFKGSSSEGLPVAVDPMYLEEKDFDKLVKPYESAFGIELKNGIGGERKPVGQANVLLEGTKKLESQPQNKLGKNVEGIIGSDLSKGIFCRGGCDGNLLRKSLNLVTRLFKS